MDKLYLIFFYSKPENMMREREWKRYAWEPEINWISHLSLKQGVKGIPSLWSDTLVDMGKRVWSIDSLLYLQHRVCCYTSTCWLHNCFPELQSHLWSHTACFLWTHRFLSFRSNTVLLLYIHILRKKKTVDLFILYTYIYADYFLTVLFL